MNTLVTSIGSISAPFVIETLKNLNHTVIGTDIYPKKWIAVASEVDAFYQTAYTSSSDVYLNQILEICECESVNIILPLTDVDVDFYSNYIDLFLERNVIITISNKETISLVRNKFSVFSDLKSKIIRNIPTYFYSDYLEKCGVFPAVAKKINGRSSEGFMEIKTLDEMEFSRLKSNDYIFQPFIEGEIYVADILNNRESKKEICLIRKELTRTVNGAGIAVEIVECKKILEFISSFCKKLEIKGCINIEFIKAKDDSIYLMDINPRPSAGVVFSNIAGYNFIENHINSFLGKPIADLTEYRYGLVITRKYIEIVVE